MPMRLRNEFTLKVQIFMRASLEGEDATRWTAREQARLPSEGSKKNRTLGFGCLGQIAAKNGLFHSRSAPVRRRKPQYKIHPPWLRQLDGNARLWRRRLEKIGLLEQLHLTGRFLHERRALRFGCVQECSFRFLPWLVPVQRNDQGIETILLRGIFFDQGIREKQTIGKNRHTSRIQMCRLPWPDFQQFRGKHVMVQYHASMSGNLDTVTDRVHFPSDPERRAAPTEDQFFGG